MPALTTFGGEDGDGRSQRLPRGRHGFLPEVVAHTQRERMIEAVTEVSAEVGYPETTVARIIERAGVSRSTFYAQFSDRRDCMLAAFERWSSLIEAEIEAAALGASDGPAAIRAALRRALDLLAFDPARASLLTAQILSLVPEGREAQHATITRLANCLYAIRGETSRGATRGSEWEWCVVAGLVALVARRVVAGEADRLPELEPQLAWIALGGGSM